MRPETRFARTPDGAYLAFQVTGDGPVDLVLLRGWYSSIEHEWDEPVLARILRRLGAMGRLIRFDRRGAGLSDRLVGRPVPTVEERLDDLQAVMDAAGSRQAVMIGLADGATLGTVFAATHPERTAGLVLYESPRPAPSPGEHADAIARAEAFAERVRTQWATRELAAAFIATGAPSRADDAHLVDWMLEDFRVSGSGDDAAAMVRVAAATDIASALPAVHVPTLVTAREGSRAGAARYLADQIADSELAILPGADHMLLGGDCDAFLRVLQRFLDDLVSPVEPPDRILATLLFVDIVESTARAVAMGDRAWTTLLETHHAATLKLVAAHRGREVDSAGDGLFAAFDGPGRAIRCALAVAETARANGLEVRAGLHTGEVETVVGRLRGIAVHVAARVSAAAGASEVLVTGTVRDLVAGSGLVFDDRGVHELKGVPEPYRLWAARD